MRTSINDKPRSKLAPSCAPLNHNPAESADVFAASCCSRRGCGHMQKQQKFDFEKINWKFRFSHGGILRNSRKGRGQRPLSGKEPIHLVIKANKECLYGGFRSHRRYFLIQKIVDRYARKFFVKIEQISIQNDHVHFLIRASRRTQYQKFFKVVCGQIAQQFQKQGLLNFAINLQEEKAVTPIQSQKALEIPTVYARGSGLEGLSDGRMLCKTQ